MRRNNIFTAYRQFNKKWGGRRIRFHDLRHTAITLWAHQRCKPEVIQGMADHEGLKTTMKYIHLVGRRVEAFANQLDIFFGRRPIDFG